MIWSYVSDIWVSTCQNWFWIDCLRPAGWGLRPAGQWCRRPTCAIRQRVWLGFLSVSYIRLRPAREALRTARKCGRTDPAVTIFDKYLKGMFYPFSAERVTPFHSHCLNSCVEYSSSKEVRFCWEEERSKDPTSTFFTPGTPSVAEPLVDEGDARQATSRVRHTLQRYNSGPSTHLLRRLIDKLFVWQDLTNCNCVRLEKF